MKPDYLNEVRRQLGEIYSERKRLLALLGPEVAPSVPEQQVREQLNELDTRQAEMAATLRKYVEVVWMPTYERLSLAVNAHEGAHLQALAKAQQEQAAADQARAQLLRHWQSDKDIWREIGISRPPSPERRELNIGRGQRSTYSFGPPSERRLIDGA